MIASCYNLWLNLTGTIKLKSLAFAIEIEGAFCFIRKSKFFFAVKTAPQGRIIQMSQRLRAAAFFHFINLPTAGLDTPLFFYALKKQDFPNPANPYIDTRDITARL